MEATETKEISKYQFYKMRKRLIDKVQYFANVNTRLKTISITDTKLNNLGTTQKENLNKLLDLGYKIQYSII